jgi:hypothetical protein
MSYLHPKASHFTSLAAKLTLPLPFFLLWSQPSALEILYRLVFVAVSANQLDVARVIGTALELRYDVITVKRPTPYTANRAVA